MVMPAAAPAGISPAEDTVASGCGSACWWRVGQRERLEGFGGRPLQYGAVQRVAGAVAGAVPALFIVVEGNGAAEVGAPTGQGGQLPVGVAAYRGEVSAD